MSRNATNYDRCANSPEESEAQDRMSLSIHIGRVRDRIRALQRNVVMSRHDREQQLSEANEELASLLSRAKKL